MQGDVKHRTKTADDAGLHAVFNEKLMCQTIWKQLEVDEEIIFKAWDEDILTDDFIGQSKPMSYRHFCLNEEANEYTVDLFDKREKVGVLKLIAQYDYGEIKKKPMKQVNESGLAALWKGCSSVKYDDEQILTQGLKIAMRIKIEEHQKNTIEARIRKLQREETSAKKRIEAAMR